MKDFKKTEIFVKKDQDPIAVALKHTHCPICKKPLDNEWSCQKCKRYLVFVSE